MRLRYRYALCAVFGAAVVGCVEASTPKSSAPASDKIAPAEAISYADGDIAAVTSGGRALEMRYATAMSGENAPPAPGGGEAAGIDRRIIYSAAIDLVVEQFDGMPERIAELVAAHAGYVADSTLAGSTGENRSATWRLRVPVAQFDAFVVAVKGLGELRRASTESRDVSEEYYDVEARIRNKTREEQRLLELLENRPGKLEDVIAIERELARVREELERTQGRQRVLANLTQLTTVTLTVSEIHDYTPEDSPSFATRVRRAFGGSIDGMMATAASSVVALAAGLPWFFVGTACVVPCYVAVRHARKKRSW